jgi:PKD domain-containing protein
MRASAARNGRWTIWLVLGLLLASALPLSLLAAPGHPPAPTPVRPSASPAFAAATALTQAQASLATGRAGPPALPSAGPSAALTWTNVSYRTNSPYTGNGFVGDTRALSATFDPHDGAVLVFGGESWNQWFGDYAWTYANATWTMAGPWANGSNYYQTGYPAARSHAALAYDARDAYALLFGGYGWVNAARSITNVTSFNDTWSYVGGNWTNRTTSVAPSPRYGAAMVYDPVDGYLVLFGGYQRGSTGPSRPLDDTWTYAGGVWTNVTASAGSPPPAPSVGWAAPSASPAFAWDAHDGDAVLLVPSARSWTTETWTFVNGSWSNRTALAGPLPFRVGAAVAYDAALGAVVRIGGGASDDADFQNDTWAYAGGRWSLQQVGGAPPGFQFAASAYDPNTGCVLVAAGETAGLAWPNATWSLCGSQLSNASAGSASPPTGWVDRTDFSSPGPRYQFARTMTYDAHDGYVVLYDGVQPMSALDHGWVPAETWSYANGSWRNLTATAGTPPPACGGCEAMAYDSGDGYVLLYETSDVGYHLAVQTWKFSGGHWTNLTGSLAVQPPPFLLTQLLCDDPADGYVLLYGVDRLNGSAPQTWSYAAGAWTNLTANQTVTPPYLSVWSGEGPMTYDAADGYVLFLLPSVLRAQPDLQFFTFSHGHWSNTTAMRGSPGWRTGATMEYDSFAKGVLLFGGLDWNFNRLGDTWLYAGGNWTRLVATPGPPDSPSPRSFATSANDPATGCVDLFAGLDPQDGGWGYLGFGGELWSYCGNPLNRSPTSSPEGLPLRVSVAPARSSGQAPLTTTVAIAIAGGTGPYAVRFCLNGHCTESILDSNATPWAPSVDLTELGPTTVTAIVVDAVGARAVGTATLLVTAAPNLSATAADRVGSTVAPAAAMLWANVSGGVPPYTVQWDFGDGTSGSGISGFGTSHRYLAAGDYTPTLLVVDSTGQTARVSAPPIRVLGPSNPSSAGTVLGQWQHAIVSWSGAAVAALVGAALVGGLLGARARRQREARAVLDSLEERTTSPARGGRSGR